MVRDFPQCQLKMDKRTLSVGSLCTRGPKPWCLLYTSIKILGQVHRTLPTSPPRLLAISSGLLSCYRFPLLSCDLLSFASARVLSYSICPRVGVGGGEVKSVTRSLSVCLFGFVLFCFF